MFWLIAAKTETYPYNPLWIKLKILTDQFRVPPIINDDVDIAKEADANVAHLGQEGDKVWKLLSAATSPFAAG